MRINTLISEGTKTWFIFMGIGLALIAILFLIVYALSKWWDKKMKDMPQGGYTSYSKGATLDPSDSEEWKTYNVMKRALLDANEEQNDKIQDILDEIKEVKDERVYAQEDKISELEDRIKELEKQLKEKDND